MLLYVTEANIVYSGKDVYILLEISGVAFLGCLDRESRENSKVAH
jgi:hypothetical protein